MLLFLFKVKFFVKRMMGRIIASNNFNEIVHLYKSLVTVLCSPFSSDQIVYTVGTALDHNEVNFFIFYVFI